MIWNRLSPWKQGEKTCPNKKFHAFPHPAASLNLEIFLKKDIYWSHNEKHSFKIKVLTTKKEETKIAQPKEDKIELLKTLLSSHIWNYTTSLKMQLIYSILIFPSLLKIKGLKGRNVWNLIKYNYKFV